MVVVVGPPTNALGGALASSSCQASRNDSVLTSRVGCFISQCFTFHASGSP